MMLSGRLSIYQLAIENGHSVPQLRSTNMFRCKSCEISYPTQEELDIHMEEDHEFFCKICQRQYSSRLCYKQHLKSRGRSGCPDPTRIGPTRAIFRKPDPTRGPIFQFQKSPTRPDFESKARGYPKEFFCVKIPTF